MAFVDGPSREQRPTEHGTKGGTTAGDSTKAEMESDHMAMKSYVKMDVEAVVGP